MQTVDSRERRLTVLQWRDLFVKHNHQSQTQFGSALFANILSDVCVLWVRLWYWGSYYINAFSLALLYYLRLLFLLKWSKLKTDLFCVCINVRSFIDDDQALWGRTWTTHIGQRLVKNNLKCCLAASQWVDWQWKLCESMDSLTV